MSMQIWREEGETRTVAHRLAVPEVAVCPTPTHALSHTHAHTHVDVKHGR